MTRPARAAPAPGEPSLLCTPEDDGACSYSQPDDPTAAALLALWEHGKLCDCVLVSAVDGTALRAHRLVLAAASGYFRAMFTGAGTAMREARESAAADASGPLEPAGDATAAAAADQEQHAQARRVVLHYGAHQLSALLEAVYARRVRVAAGSVGWLMEMGGYLECPVITSACCQYLRSALAPPSAVDVLLMAHQYHCDALRRDALSYLCARLPSLVQSEWRPSLARLPRELLVELLASEELVVESELDVLGTVADWVAAEPGRAAHLPELLGLVQLAALPPEPAAATPCLAALSSSPEGRSVVDAVYQQIRLRAAGAAAGGGSPGGGGGGALGGGGAAPAAAAAAAAAARQELLAGARPAAAGPQARPDPDGAQPAPQPPPSPGSASTGAPAAPAAPAAAAHGDGHGAARVGARRAGMHLENGTWPAARRRAYRPSKLLVAGGHDPSWRSLRGVEVLDPLDPDPAWAPGAALLPSHAMPFASSALLGRDLYIVGGAMFSSVVARYEGGAPGGGGGGGGAWAACPALATPRVHAAVAAAAGRLFVCGGRSQVNQVLATVEAYTPGADSWEAVPAPMGEARYACAAASMGGVVYVVGGQSGRSAIFSTLAALDADSGRWLPAPSARMAAGRKYCGAAPLNGRLYVCGGLADAGRRRLASVEAFDPREGVFREVAPMRAARSSCGAAALGDRLYVAGGGADGSGFHDSVEVFEPAMGRWRPGPPLAAARSGLALAAI